MEELLLTRDQFREAVFARDGHKCVNCGEEGQDAHHILERRLFDDGGYYVDNGATVCGECHYQAESTLLTCDTLRERAGIQRVVLPTHLYEDQKYDKWGNPILANGQRLRGELFDDESVQKVIAPVLHLFTNRVKYPRTWHVPWSPGFTKDDCVMTDTSQWDGMEVVITEKMDGENTTFYRDGMHARSLDYEPHVSRDRVRAIWAKVGYEIPEGWRVCGENLAATHSIKYLDLPDYFLVYSIWIQQTCLSWDDTLMYAELLGLQTVPVMYRGLWDETMIRGLKIDPEKHEGYVVRPTGEFHFRQFRHMVGKYVRPSHVQTHGHWMRMRLDWNEVKA